MNRTTARIVLTVAGAGALTGMAAGAAFADTPDSGSASAATGAAEGNATAPNYVLKDAPPLPIGNQVATVFDVAAPAYGVLGALG